MTLPYIKIVPASELHVSEPNPRWFGNRPNPKSDTCWTNKNWLKSRFHFSFADYHNASNINFGTLRVMNDDLVQPHRGFGTHPHSNMEIITYIVDGALTHQDSMGTQETVGRGGIQFMTAGTGIQHSEYNHGDKPLRFVQTWIKPRSGSLKPNYGSYKGSAAAEERKNKLFHLVSDVAKDSSTTTTTPVKINQDTDVYASELDLGKKVNFELPKGRHGYLLCIEGGVKINGKQLRRHDGCEITGSGNLEIEAVDVERTENGRVAHILLFVMEEVEGSGRKDIRPPRQ